jgi:hypothetical protein
MSMDKPEDFGRGPAAEVRRWLKELDLSSKTEKDWREVGEKIWDRYRGTRRRKNSFNILWSNTETLAPALFNTPPSPDVRRRFRDEDPVGKIVSQMLERCLEFQTDTERFSGSMKSVVLDSILPGRGVSRVKYVPEFAPSEPIAQPVDGSPEMGQEVSETAELGAVSDVTADGYGDVLAWEQCEIEHVQWDDFRRGPGKCWAEVQWVAYRHRMTRDEIEDLAGPDVAREITLDKCQDESIDKDEHLKTVFGTGEVWEFWCKEDRKVRYISAGYTKKALKTLDDPLKLMDFFPSPEPLYAIDDSSSLIPTSLFEQYREQADELDRVSSRINRIVDALKVRGIYDSTLAEFSELMRADDNKLIPAQNLSSLAAYQEKGGLDKAIYWMPIEQAAKVLQVLYEQREASKAVIYELSGIADVRRGATDPNETLGAQKLKADFGNQRISGLKMRVERYARDVMRLMAELIAGKFQPETLTQMAQMPIPTNQEIETQKAELLQKMAISGQQPDPQQLPPRPISLEQVMQVMRDDATRMFKIDVETDSMVSATMNEDMQGLGQVLTDVVQFIQGVGPAVQMGAFPIEAVKEIVMTIARRSKMGSAVEDALDKIQAPQGQGDPEQAKAQAATQQAEIKAQSVAQVAQMQAANKAQIAEIEAKYQQQTDLLRQQAEAAQHSQKIDLEAQLAQMREQFQNADNERQREFEAWKIKTQEQTKLDVAQVNAQSVITSAQESASDNAVRD